MFTLIPQAPIGSHESGCFVNRGYGRGGVEVHRFDDYPVSEQAERFHAARIASDYTLRTAASAMGLKPSELSGLEFGRFTLSTEDWSRAIDLMHAHSTRPSLPRP